MAKKVIEAQIPQVGDGISLWNNESDRPLAIMGKVGRVRQTALSIKVTILGLHTTQEFTIYRANGELPPFHWGPSDLLFGLPVELPEEETTEAVHTVPMSAEEVSAALVRDFWPLISGDCTIAMIRHVAATAARGLLDEMERRRK